MGVGYTKIGPNRLTSLMYDPLPSCIPASGIPDDETIGVMETFPPDRLSRGTLLWVTGSTNAKKWFLEYSTFEF